MWKPRYDLVRTIVQWAERVQEDRDGLREVCRDLGDLTLLVERRAAQITRWGSVQSGGGDAGAPAENSIHPSRGGLLVGETAGG